MGIEVLIPIIAQYGIPIAQRIWEMAQSGREMTQADWDELNRLTALTPARHLELVAQTAGVPMTDPRIQAIQALIK